VIVCLFSNLWCQSKSKIDRASRSGEGPLVDPVGVSCAVDKENAEVVACIGAQGVGNPSVYSTIDGGANWTETG